MAPFSKPETVLKQAEGLVSVGQSHAALQSLTEMFQSKRFRSTPLASLEPIMLRFVELCVEMRKGRTAKEGLMQYKNIAQNTSVASIEVVVNRFIQLSDAKVQDAQEKADKVVALTDVDDLEAMETPESILLGAVSGDQNKDRTDRALVTPWLKFLWESYRTALETLKNNARLEGIYQQIAQQAFKFCLKHQRKVEFRRLCETLRLHLSNVAKYAHQPHAINLSDSDTLQHHLDTRFAQLNSSVELELWQEAFRSVEDVHNLLTMAKKSPKPAMMAGYYEKLTKIFLMSGNALYHAAAWGRYYSIVMAIGGKSEEDLTRLAGQVLISALAVPVGLHTDEGVPVEEGRGKSSRLTSLLGLAKVPTRTGLLKDALSRNVHKLAPETIKSLYNILEVTFDPLTLCSSLAPFLLTLSQDPSYSQYLPLLQRALLSRLLSQLSQVYSSIRISNLLDLLAPLRDAGVSSDDTYKEEGVEAYVMGCAQRGELNVRVNHNSGSITFVDDPFSSTDDSFSSTSVISRELPIQPSTTDLVRTRLSSLAICLHNSLAIIYPRANVLSEDEQKARFSALAAAAHEDRRALQMRRSLIVRRRELVSELSLRREKEEASRRAEINRREKEEESRRAIEDVKRREMERVKKDIEIIRNEEARKLAQSLNEKGNIAMDINDMENINTDTLMRMHVEQLEKKKRELAQRMHVIGKRLDHVERAYRKEERPLLSKDYELQQENDRATFEAIQKARLESSKITHKKDLETKQRLARMTNDYLARKKDVLAKRGEEFAQKREKAQRKVEEEKAKRRQAVLAGREEERKRLETEERQKREQEEEEARLEAERIAEEERLLAEEEAAAAAIEAAKREEEERLAALRKKREEEREEARRAAALQSKREEEAEAHRAARRAEQLTASKAADTGASVWRRSTPSNTAPSTPAPVHVSSTPPRSGSPAAPAKYRPGALKGSTTRATDPSSDRPSSPAPAAPAKEGAWVPRSRVDSQKEDDTGTKTWRSSRLAAATATDEPPKKSEETWRPSRLRSEEQPPVAREGSSGAPPAVRNDPDGFHTVEKRGVWRRGRGRA